MQRDNLLVHYTPRQGQNFTFWGAEGREDFTNYFGEGPLHFWILGSSFGNFEHTMLWDTYSNLTYNLEWIACTLVHWIIYSTVSFRNTSPIHSVIKHTTVVLHATAASAAVPSFGNILAVKKNYNNCLKRQILISYMSEHNMALYFEETIIIL